jgi:hypothetical protein
MCQGLESRLRPVPIPPGQFIGTERICTSFGVFHFLKRLEHLIKFAELCLLGMVKNSCYIRSHALYDSVSAITNVNNL